MAFSRAQQPEFRGLVAVAWQVFCRDQNKVATTKVERSWYEAQLIEATGHASTSDCNAGGDYDRAMAHFEALGRSGSIKWQMKLFRGDANRIDHEIKRVCDDHNIDEEYMRAIARKALRLSVLPELHLLTKEMRLTILCACKQQVARDRVAAGIQTPQISRRTGREKRGQVKLYHAALDAKKEPSKSEPEEDPF
ncbi:MAG TPA: hypothetical protein VFV83_08775 [Chthoniobacteraceae bacterium]|nr:hypothetical protein [Chthoniobacteraceae bacterium]